MMALYKIVLCGFIDKLALLCFVSYRVAAKIASYDRMRAWCYLL